MTTIAPRLRPFRARLWIRRAIELGALGLAVGLAAATAVVVGARLTGLPASSYALLLPAAGLAIAFAAALLRPPTTWDAAAAADELGLAERVTSALHAAHVAHPAATLIEVQALDRLRLVDPAGVRVRPAARRLQPVVLAAAALALAVLVPLPGLGGRAAQAADRAAIDEARASIEEVAAQIEPIAPEPAVRRIAAELDTLDKALTESKDLESAAQAIERAQERIASLARGEDFAARRTLDALASAWAGDPRLGGLAQALRERNAEAIRAAIDAIAAELADLDDAGRRDLQLDLQAAANLARDVPDLAGALRGAAVAAAADNDQPPHPNPLPLARGRGERERGGLGAGLAAALSEAAGAAGSLGATEAALAGLGQARAGLGAAGALAAAAGGAGGHAEIGRAHV